MSFQIDLLHENERKVGSIATIKAVAKGLVLLLIGLMVLLVAQLSFALVARNRNLSDLEESWKLLDRRQEMAMTMRSQMNYNEATLAQLEQWRDTRLRWDRQLLALFYTTPTSIQLRKISIDPMGIHVDPTAPAQSTGLQRRWTMALSGRAEGGTPLIDVTRFKGSLATYPTMSNLVSKVGVTFGPDETTTDPDDRSFYISITYTVLPQS
jgi:Tfp pilus assembly protein PilN